MRYSSMSTCFYSGHAPTINTQVTRLLAFRVRFSALRVLKTCDVCFPSRLIIKIMASYSLLIPCLIPCSFQPVPGVVFGTGLVELTSRKQKKDGKDENKSTLCFCSQNLLCMNSLSVWEINRDHWDFGVVFLSLCLSISLSVSLCARACMCTYIA